MNKLLFALILLLTYSQQGISQTAFTAEPEKFLKEITSYLGQVRKDDAKQFGKEFEAEWIEGKFTTSQRAAVYATTNDMALARRKPYPEMKNYLVSVLYAVKTGMNDSEFEEWHATVEKALSEKNKKRFTTYIASCASLLKSNNLYESSSTIWKASSNAYHFTYEKEPIIVFDEMDLKCYAKNDSSVLYKTKGMYYPNKNKWIGNGGTITWERSELAPDKFYAEIGDYKISMKGTGFKVDSVKFHSTYFDEPIIGRLRENVISKRSIEQVSFPKFVSYDKRLLIENIFPNVDYEGGFTMEGNHLLGAGTIENPSKVTFHYKDKEFITAQALVFVITDDGVASDRAKVKINIDNDSITHPGVLFQYNAKTGNNKITLTRGDGITSAPYSNSYHKLDIYSEAIYWKLGDPVINFAPLYGSTDTSARFVSHDYFNQGIYDKFTTRSGNPLMNLKKASQLKKTNILSFQETVAALRTTKVDAENELYELMILGFLEYNKELETVILKEKLFNYILQRANKKDFDVIDITSNSSRNAELSLVSFDLSIRGVQKTNLSSAQFVRIYPRGEEIVVKKNRDMLFAGIVNTGRTEYYGDQFTFDYNDFKINLVDCQFMNIRPKNENHDPTIPLRLFSKIIGISGTILIDEPKNKSGTDTTFHQYPILKCTKKSYVFYDDKSIQKGAYKKKDFKFILEPFEMDSLDNFTNAGVAFDGEFISAGIFPNMDETLRIQDDFSLGFIRTAPKGGIGIYGEKANYNNQIKLSNRGLQGSGDIDYLTSHAESTQITFFPDSVNAIAEVYYNEPNESDVKVPEVYGKMVYVSYIPEKKVLYASSYEGEDLVMFPDSVAVLSGKIALRPDGMTGSGNIFIENGEILSNLFKFKHHIFDADTSEFKLRTIDLDQMAFKTENVSAHVDFYDRKGQFKSNEGESIVEFPENQYICYMDQFNWLMDQDDLEMESKGKSSDLNIDSDLDLAGSNFYSVHPKQDSLSFKSPKAKFDVRKKIITCQKVEYVTVADARIFPDSGIVVIKKKAKMVPFENAKILANYITKYHNIFDAKVKISAKKEYQASGYYNYVDESKAQQKIYFSNIRPDTTYQTTAKGTVKENSNFKLSPQYDYYGEIEMFASLKELTFTGDVKLSDHDCKGIDRNWMSFTAQIDPENIYIPVSKDMFDSQGTPIGVGMVINTDEIGMYSTFLSNKKKSDHINIMSADGFLRYDKNANEYRISSKEKLSEINLPGNYVSLNQDNCLMKGDGQFNFGAELGLIEVLPVGTMEYDPNKDALNIKASLKVNFPFNEAALDKMAKQFEDYADLPALDFNNSTYEKSLREFLGLEKSDKIISDLNIYGKIKGKMPEEIISTLYFADVHFKWDKEAKAYVSQGKIGLATTMKKQIFKQIDGKIVVYKRPTGDEISIILNLDENNYYFFNYKRGLLQTFSSNEDFNTVIMETKKDKTKFKAPKGKEDLTFMLGSKTKATAFKRKFE